VTWGTDDGTLGRVVDPAGTAWQGRRMAEVVVIATVRPAPGRLQEVVDLIAGNVPVVHDEDGCLLYAVTRIEEPELVVFVERWASADALAAHAAAPHMAATNERLAPLLARPTEVWTGMAVPAGDPVKGAF